MVTTSLRLVIKLITYLYVVSNAESNWNGRSSPAIPSPLSASMRTLPAVKVDPTGKIYTTQILKQQLANELNLPLRDLRIVDPSFPSQIQATFATRPNAILFCIENIKVVVQNDEALVFSPFQPEVQEFIPALQQQIALNNAEASNEAKPLRFEHVVLETALNVVCSSLNKRVRALYPTVASTLNGLRAESRGLDVVQTQVDELLPLKNKIDELRKRVKEIKRAITDILNNDEDMAMMYLSDRKGGIVVDTRDSITHDDGIDGTVEPVNTMLLEMLFETYLNEIEWIASEIEEVIDEITNTEENVVLQLDLLRNRILRFELTLSISSFVVTCGALVTGLFGMNLLSHLESSPLVFYFISMLIAVGCGTLFVSLKQFAKREKLF